MVNLINDIEWKFTNIGIRIFNKLIRWLNLIRFVNWNVRVVSGLKYPSLVIGCD